MAFVTQSADAHDLEIPSAKRQRLNPASEGVACFTDFEGEGVRSLSSGGEIVCFGMIPSIPARCERRGSAATVFAVSLGTSGQFITKDGSGVRGKISSTHYAQLLQFLLEADMLILSARCCFSNESNGCKSSSDYSCSLDVTVYGSIEYFETIGSWFQDYEVYLQDPRTCDLDVKYCNPHRLSFEQLDDNPLLSEFVERTTSLIHLQAIGDRPDLLDILNSQNDLEETSQPAFIRSSLHRHQKQALTFMLRRERGWNFYDSGMDIWEIADTSHTRLYINRISEAQQAIEPPEFSGGIIADPMGLGKTLTMISLIATDLQFSAPYHNDSSWELDEENNHPVQATLVVVPQPLLNTWEEELSRHQQEGTIAAFRHHARSKLADISQIKAVNVVLTTYHTLSADWKAVKAGDSNIMFSVRWKRIILDEAHIIRNMKSRLARAVCSLDATSRWAVTGTPIQNHINDLAALLKFIRVHPYDEPKRFEADISRLWKSGDDKEAVERLKRLAGCLILRRSQRTVDLPARHDMRCPVDFSKAERDVYDNIKNTTLAKMDEVILHESELAKSGMFVNFLQQIESMRLVCNLGLHYHTRHDDDKFIQGASNWTDNAQNFFNIQRRMELISCLQCDSVLDPENIFLDDAFRADPHFSRCLKYTCPNCSHKTLLAGQKIVCGHQPRCPSAPVSLSHSFSEETLGQSLLPAPSSSLELPSKVRALIADLRGLPTDTKCIVFSAWRLTLDVVETGLCEAGIRCVRFDGKVPQVQRPAVLNQFRADPALRVLLLTLSCGAVGLTLTEASRAYLMEPHWNPTIEEQALARIHRIGQRREVTTVRFYIRDSFEERVMEVQESKKNLAGVLLSGHDGGQADDSLDALQRLRSLL